MLFRSAFNATLDNVFRNQPHTADTAYQGVQAVYAALAAEKGNYSGVYDDDLGKKAITIAMGNVAEHNDKKVLPPYGMTESDFLNKAKAKFTQSAAELGVPWDNVALENASGQGQYYIQVGAGYLLAKNGQPLMLDLNTPAVPRVQP